MKALDANRSKGKILVFPFDLMSHYLRCIELARRYQDHEVVFAYSEKYDLFVRKAGFGSFTVKSFNVEAVMKCVVKFDFSWLNYKDLEEVLLSQVNAIRVSGPSFVIGDNSPTLKMAAEITGVKYVSLMNGYMSGFYDGDRPVSRTHFSYRFINKLPPGVNASITKIAERVSFNILHRPFKTLRKKYGLRKVNGYLNELQGDENLICDAASLFPQKKLPKHYRIVGPLLYSSNVKEDDLLSSLGFGKPNICVCLGSGGDWLSLKFLTEKKYATVNIIVAGDIHRHLIADHIFHKNFINLNAVLPGCRFMICHGGNGTIYEGLRHKKFILCLTSHFEQEWNAKRLEQLNLGIMINDDPAKYVDDQIGMILHSGQ